MVQRLRLEAGYWWQKLELSGRNTLEARVEAGDRGRGWWQGADAAGRG